MLGAAFGNSLEYVKELFHCLQRVEYPERSCAVWTRSEDTRVAREENLPKRASWKRCSVMGCPAKAVEYMKKQHRARKRCGFDSSGDRDKLS